MQDPRFSNELAGFKKRLAAIFTAAVVCIFAGGFAYQHHYQKAIKKDAEDLLSSIKRFKTDQILFWRADRFNDTNSLLDSPILSAYLNSLAANPGDAELRDKLRDRLHSYLKHNKYRSAILAWPDGSILTAVGENTRVLPPEAIALIRKAELSGRTELGDFYIGPAGRPRIDIASKAASAPGNKRLYLVLEIAPDDYLYPLLRTWPTNTRSGETVLARKEGREILFLGDLRNAENAGLKLRLPFADDKLPIALALNGEEGIVGGRDYSGRRVLASIGLIPGTNWGIEVKEDWAEIMAESGRLSAIMLLLTFFLVATAGGWAYLLFKLQTERYSKTLAEVETEKDRYKFNFETLAEKANDMILLADPAERTLLMVNRKTCETYGYTEEEMLRIKPEQLLAPDDLKAFNARFATLAEGKSALYEATHMRKDGTRFPLEVSATGIKQGGKNLVFFICRDITERKKAEDELRRTQDGLRKNLRLYTILAQINQAAAQTKDLNKLYCRLCEVAVQAGGFTMAWVGYPDRDTGRVLPLCSAGNAGEYLSHIKIETKDGATAKGPTGTAARSGGVTACQDIETDPYMQPWREKALALGYRSSAALPLYDGTQLTAILNVYSSEKNFFTEEEIKLLTEIKDDISLAIEAVSAEAKRGSAQNALERTAAQLTHMMDAMPVVLYTLRLVSGKLLPQWVSGNSQSVTGHEPAELLDPGWFERALHPEDKSLTLSEMGQVFKKGQVSHDFRLARKDGSGYVWVHSQLRAGPEGSGEINGSWTDITPLKESEMRFKKLFEKAPLAARPPSQAGRDEIYLIDPATGTISFASIGALKSLGYTRAEIERKKCWEIITEFTEDSYKALLTPLIKKQKKLLILETEHRRKDGSPYPVQCRAQLLEASSGPILLVVSTEVLEGPGNAEKQAK